MSGRFLFGVSPESLFLYVRPIRSRGDNGWLEECSTPSGLRAFHFNVRSDFAGQHLPQLLLRGSEPVWALRAGEAMARAQGQRGVRQRCWRISPDHAQGNAEAAGDFLAVAFLPVIGVENALSQVREIIFRIDGRP